MVNIKAVAAVALLAVTSSPAENKTPLFGTWTGSVGKYKIIACFQAKEDEHYTNGSYYYLKYRQPIPLDVVNKDV